MINFKMTSSCSHEKITADMIAGYCPDCGDYVENHWYISRCECCGIKQTARVVRGRVSASTRYCRNCGSSSFKNEELETIDLVNINYAVVLKQAVAVRKQSIIQTWLDNYTYSPIKLLSSY